MAGSKLFIGKMLDDLMATMNTLSDRMQQNVTLLTNVSTNTSQAVNRLNVTASSNMKNQLPSGTTVKTGGGGYNNTEYFDLFSLYGFVDGTVKLDASCTDTVTAFNGTSADNVYLVAVVEGTEYILATAGSVGATTNVLTGYAVFPIAYGNAIKLKLKVVAAASKNANNHSLSFAVNSIKISYDLRQIVQQGGFVW